MDIKLTKEMKRANKMTKKMLKNSLKLGNSKGYISIGK